MSSIRKRKSKLKYVDEDADAQMESWIRKKQYSPEVVLAKRRRHLYDSMWDFIDNRDNTERLKYVSGIEQYYREFFRVELENKNDPSFRDQFEEFFRNIRRNTRHANILQMFIIFTSLVLSMNARNYLCPTPPAPDSKDKDESLVDRRVFSKFERHRLLPMFYDLRDGTTLTVNTFVSKLNGLYISLLSPNPITVLKYGNPRQIVFPKE